MKKNWKNFPPNKAVFLISLLFFLTVPALTCRAAGKEPADPLRQAALQGNAESQLALGTEYFFGKNRIMNQSLGVYWYRRAADPGNARAQYNLAVCMERGWGTRKSPILAYSYYRKASETIPAAAIRKYQLLYAGIPEEQHENYTIPGIAAAPGQALAGLDKLARSGSFTACRVLAELLMADPEFRKKDGKRIQLLLEQAVQSPAPESRAMLLLASVLEKGIGGNFDSKRSAGLIQRAAAMEDPEGMLRYGLLLEHGRLGKSDPLKAIGYYRKAAEKGSPAAMVALAEQMKSGFHIPEDLAGAFEYFARAADLNFPAAFSELGDCYFYGRGTAVQQEKALDLYMRGANMNDPRSCFRLGECYRDGKGVPADPAGAVYWFRKAAEQEMPGAVRCLGIAFLSGAGVKKNISAGTQLLKRAAELGDTEARNLLLSGGF